MAEAEAQGCAGSARLVLRGAVGYSWPGWVMGVATWQVVSAFALGGH